MHIHIHTYIHKYIHMYIHAYIHICIYMHVSANPYILRATVSSVFIYIYVHTHKYLLFEGHPENILNKQNTGT